MEEIKIYLDKEKKNEIQENIEFEKIIAGETTKRQIYLYNNTKYYINIDLKLEGENIEISKEITQIAPKQTEKVEFEFTPDITLMQPIRAQLKVKINYLVR